MPEPLKVALIGREGRLGRAACDWIRGDEELELFGAVDVGDSWEALRGACVALDVTRAGLGLPHGERLLEMGLRPVIGTSGVSPAEAAALDHKAKELRLGGAVVPNFSVGFLALASAANAAKGRLPSASILEAHHTQKVDAPSGTSIQLANQLQLGLEGITSLRMEGLTAVHEVRFWGGDDLVTLRHESRGLQGFRDGLLMSLKYAAHADGVAYGLGEVLGEACNVQP